MVTTCPTCGTVLVQAEKKPPEQLAWGASVSQTFKDRVRWIGETLGVDPNDLMMCMAWESARTFSANVKNAAGSGAVGLIQFMPSTAKALGTSTAELAKMTPEDQLRYVYKYFRPYAGKLKNLGDVYMAILWPKAIGKPDSYVLFDGSLAPTAYRQNAGLDVDRNHQVTRAECIAKVYANGQEGFKSQHLG
jgi:hypothetical protein